MNLQLIENIIAIAEEKNITKAAERLFISQSALNQQLLNLENELGTKLFIRNRNEWSITPSGELYIQYGRQMLNMKRELYSRISDLSRAHNETLHVGATLSFGDEFFSQMYPAFHAVCPNIILNFHSINGNKIINSVAKGTLDFGILILPEQSDPRLHYETIDQSELFLALPADHPEADVLSGKAEEKGGLEIADLRNLQFVCAPRDSLESGIIRGLFEDAGYTCSVNCIQQGFLYRMSLVKSSGLATFVGKHHQRDLPEGILLLPLRDHPKLLVSFLTRKNRYMSDPMKEVLKLSRIYWDRLLH